MIWGNFSINYLMEAREAKGKKKKKYRESEDGGWLDNWKKESALPSKGGGVGYKSLQGATNREEG